MHLSLRIFKHDVRTLCYLLYLNKSANDLGGFGDLPGIRFKVVKVSGAALLALWKERQLK